MEKEFKTKNVRFNIEMPVDIRAELKQQAAKKNIPLRTYALRALLNQLKKDKSYE